MNGNHPLVKDRPATAEELYDARCFVLNFNGPGIVRAAERLEISTGYLSQLLQGKRKRQLTIGELQRLHDPYPPKSPAPLRQK